VRIEPSLVAWLAGWLIGGCTCYMAGPGSRTLTLTLTFDRMWLVMDGWMDGGMDGWKIPMCFQQPLAPPRQCAIHVNLVSEIEGELFLNIEIGISALANIDR